MKLPNIKQAIRSLGRRPSLRVVTVLSSHHLTPDMIRVTFDGSSLQGSPKGREGGNCKLLIPEPGEDRTQFEKRLTDGPLPVRRTYSVRNFDDDTQQLTIDFVDHGDNGPASRWAVQAKPGDFLGFRGPSLPKLTHFEADWYLVAADPSATPMAAATLEAMPRDARGVAVFEITEAGDRQDIDMPKGIEAHWLLHRDPKKPSDAQEQLIRSLSWPTGRVQTCIAGESGVIRALRTYLQNEKGLPKKDVYISGYWKIGLVEDEHQKVKNRET